MKTYNDNATRPKVTYEDIQRRKQDVLARLRREENNIKRLTDALIDDYRRPGSGVMSLVSMKRTGSLIGSALYAYKVGRSVWKLYMKMRRR
jgi:hypothetical protein